MRHAKYRFLPSHAGLLAVGSSCILLVLLSPWLHENLLPALGLGPIRNFAVLLLLVSVFFAALTGVLIRLFRGKPPTQRIEDPDQGGAALAEALQEKIKVDRQLDLILQRLVDKQREDVAINPAIGDAPAGDYGRALAALAAEIRQLSQRTAEAAVRIADKWQ